MSLRLAHMSEGMFSNVAAHIIILAKTSKERTDEQTNEEEQKHRLGSVNSGKERCY